MPVLRKRAQIYQPDSKPTTNGLYVHSSPPRVLQLSSAHIKQLIRGGDIDKLEQIVLEGHGKKLIGEYSADYKTRMFLKNVPALMSKISLLHDAVNSDRLEELKSILSEIPDKKKKLVMAKDDSGVGLLHKAVYYDLKDIYKWLIDEFPHMISMKDAEGRTAYHYTSMCKDPEAVKKLLTAAGADPLCLDFRQHSAKYYLNHSHELELPSSQKSVSSSRKSTANKESLNFKKSNIRIWIHQRNLANLQQVVWEGHGSKLLVEHSNNPKIRKFLEAVPHIMGLIKEIHSDVQNGDLESLKNRLTPPIPPIVLSGKDINGLTPLHKAAGLGKDEIAEYIVDQYPNSVNITDNEGRTPLHYASMVKDDGKMTNFLIEHGADESSLDNKSKTAAYYKTRTSELDPKLLNIIPDCPRSAKESFAANFDWSMLTACTPTEEIQKVVKKIENHIFGNGTEAEKEKEATEEIVKGSPRENGNEEKEEEEQKPKEESLDLKENGGVEEEKMEEAKAEENEPDKEEPEEENKELDNENKEEAAEPTEEPQEAPNEPEQETKSGEVATESPREEQEKEESNTRPSSKAASKPNTRPNSTVSGEKSRPNSNIHEDKTRPNSKLIENKSRPNSIINSRTRPNSQMTETESPRKEKHEEDKPELEPEGVIEGVVNGEHEVETLNEEGQGKQNDDKEDDPEVQELVEAGNMEQLAAMVLNGEGERLVGYQSDNAELQSFLENVPIYMKFLEMFQLFKNYCSLNGVKKSQNKIKKIHVASRDGSLRDLQAALDRRKFAIAKDPISPNGASPLHVAIMFGNTSIVRYLAGRFPETVQVTDDNGRTPLHYAAVLADNGHYYNLLVHLGANTRSEDKFGHTPNYYRTHQEEFSHKALLKTFGAEESVAEEMLNDKDILPGNGQVDMPFFATEEGRYLASSLGDPLIKGLTEVANKRPEDPIAYLATYLYNFANNRNNVKSRGRTQETQQQTITGSPQTVDDNKAVPASIDVVTVEPDENDVEEDSAFSSTSRDEHGQSMLHFAAARAHGRNALFQLLIETEINVAYRDELYRTARDISIQANIPENTQEIDRYVLHIATKGDTDKLVELLLDGYDHITDIVDEDGVPIIEAVSKENQQDTVAFLQSILAFEEKRERVHHAIREGSINDVTSLLADENDTGSGKLLGIGKNSYGRCSLHIAVLCQQEEIVDYLANTFPDTLKVGDNLERTALHYAMGVEKMETISRVLVKAGAKRIVKDLKGRQPTYYFLNKSEILRLQEEEETF